MYRTRLMKTKIDYQCQWRKNSVLNANVMKTEKKSNKRKTCHRKCIIRRDIHLLVSCVQPMKDCIATSCNSYTMSPTH